MKPRLIRLSYFVWIIIPFVGFAFYQVWGWPHAIWSYRYQGEKNNANFRYTACSYVGPTGAFWRNPAQRSCSWIAFRKSSEASKQ